MARGKTTLNAARTTGTAFHIHGVTSRGSEFQNPRVHSDQFGELLKAYAVTLMQRDPPRSLYIVETNIQTREMIRYVAAFNREGVS